MEYEIIIKKEDLWHRVNLRTHYHAECEKRRDPDSDVGETSVDDEEIINTFLNNSINAIVVEQRERLKDICYKVTDGYLSLKFTTVVEGRDNLLPMLKQALTDYLVNELLIQWLFIRQRAWSDSYVAMRSEHYNRVRDIFASFHNRRIRRRPTNLAGI
jgi:hypothetical protein